MASFEIEQYEICFTKYRVEADTEAEATAKLFGGDGDVMESHSYLETAEDYGLPADEHRQLAEDLRVLPVPTLEEDGEIADWQNSHRVDIVQTGLDLLMVMDANGKADEPSVRIVRYAGRWHVIVYAHGDAPVVYVDIFGDSIEQRRFRVYDDNEDTLRD